MWCRVYARKTPMIPVHNGHGRCIGCGFDVAAYRRAEKAAEAARVEALFPAVAVARLAAALTTEGR